MTTDYLIGLCVLGDAGTGGAPSLPVDTSYADYGPFTPEQLSKLDRALTPAEQRAVDKWQSAQADAQLAAERAKGGPTSEEVSVTRKGAVIRAKPEPKPAPAAQEGTPAWLIALGVVGVVAVGAGAWMAVRRR